MACVNCKKIRSAILHGKMAEAAGLTVDALREKIGITTTTEMLAEPAAGNGDPDVEGGERGKRGR